MDVAVKDAPKSEPVTVVVTRRVKAGHEAAYEEWLTRLIGEAKRMPGYLGTNVQRPGPTGPREYTCVYRFESVEHLQAFEQSEMRARLVAAAFLAFSMARSFRRFASASTPALAAVRVCCAPLYRA